MNGTVAVSKKNKAKGDARNLMRHRGSPEPMPTEGISTWRSRPGPHSHTLPWNEHEQQQLPRALLLLSIERSAATFVLDTDQIQPKLVSKLRPITSTFRINTPMASNDAVDNKVSGQALPTVISHWVMRLSEKQLVVLACSFPRGN